jgi:TolB-like protein/class 3 adenylate cyclase/Flp pilus assembly protein TadD
MVMTTRERGATNLERRLAGILSVDVVGYSRLMSSDEEATHIRFTKHHEEIFNPKIKLHNGRIVKTTGDGFLAEFASVVDAMKFAIGVQAAVATREAHISENARISMRMGLTLGDVIVEPHDIFGDSVNTAVRLQELAEPDGVALSSAVVELTKHSLNLELDYLGALNLKNRSEPVRVFRYPSKRPDHHGETGIPSLPTERPSIAVLPVRTVNADPDNEYFTNGIFEDVIVSLAKLRELLVISRSSTLAFRHSDETTAEIGKQLGVGYLLTGTARRSRGEKLRLSIELLEARFGMCIWAEHIDTDRSGIFDLQDEIVARIVSGIAPRVRTAEMERALRKRPENFTSYDLTLRAIDWILTLKPETFSKARESLETAVRLDQNFAMAHAWAARWHSLHIGQGWSMDISKDSTEALRYASRAIEIDPENSLALATFAHINGFLLHNYDVALSYFSRALRACPNDALAWTLASATKSYVGQTREAIQYAERGLRLSPYDRNLFIYNNFLSIAHYAHGDYEEAIRSGRLALAENPNYTSSIRLMSAALAGAGQVKEAEHIGRSLMLIEPRFRLREYAQSRSPFQDKSIHDRFILDLQKAGLPE